MEISLLLSVIGVVLTVVFFAVGYRQTIGARRERARAANQGLVDTFFRRLALEEKFSLTRSDIIKVISGWAINSRVRSSDVYSLQELEDLLSARALESDYISEAQRQTIGSRIAIMFAEENNPVFVGNDIDENKIRPDLLLAIGSSLASLMAAIFATLFVSERVNIASIEFVEGAIIPTIVLITLTAAVMLVYTRVRDMSRTGPDDPVFVRSGELDLERAFYIAARRRNKTLRPSNVSLFDFVFADENGVAGIEVKRDVNRLGRQNLAKIIGRMTASIERGTISRGFIVSAEKPSEKIAAMGTEKVRIFHIPDFLSSMPENVTSGPTSATENATP